MKRIVDLPTLATMDLPTRGISAENQVRLEQVARVNVQWMINFYSPGIATAPMQPALTQPGPQNHVEAAAQHASQNKFATTATGNSSIAFEIEELVLSKPDSTPSPASKGANVGTPLFLLGSFLGLNRRRGPAREK